MPGLVQTASEKAGYPAQPAPGAAPAGQGQPGAPGQRPGPPPLSPAAKQLALAASKVLYDPQLSRQIVAMLRHYPDPATALAQVTRTVMLGLLHKAQGQVPGEALARAALSVVGMLAEMAAASKIFNAGPDVLLAAYKQLIAMVQKGAGAAPAAQGAPAAAGAPAAPQAAAPMQPQAPAGGPPTMPAPEGVM